MPVLLLTILLSGMGFGLILPSFPFVATNLGASSALATAIIGLYALGQFLSTPFWGRFSDRFGRKPLLIGSLAGAMLSYLIMALADDLWSLSFGRLLTGLMGGNIAVAMAYVSDLTPPEHRARSMGWVGGSVSVGFIAGPMLGGWLGGTAEDATLLWPGLAAAGICAVAVLGALVFLRESLPPEKRARVGGGHGPSGIAAFRQVITRPDLAPIIIAGFVVYFAMALFETIFPFWADARFAWGPREIGFGFTYLGLVVAVVQGLLVGRLVAAFGEGRILIGGIIGYAAGLLILTQASGWPLLVIGLTFTAGGGAMYLTTAHSLVSKQAGETERGLVLGAYNSTAWFGRTLGPPVTGSIFDWFGSNAPLYVSMLLFLPCVLLLLGVVAQVERKERGEKVA